MRVPSLPLPTVIAAAAMVGAGGLFGAEMPDGRALVEKYCFECHGDGSRKGDLALDALLEADGAEEASRSGWRKAWKITRHEFMPPAA